jgi:dolichol-phosphate mannosyltransferase
MSTVVVVLPVYNEASRLKTLLDRIHGVLDGEAYHIVAVDDGSRDGSDAILARACQHLPVEVITHTVNRGLAETLYDGLRWAVAHCADDDVVVTMDADDTHDPAYIRPMLAKLEQGWDVVIASRFQPGAAVVGVPPHRRLFSFGVLLLLRLFMPIRGVRDYACGYRAVRARVLAAAFQRFGERLFELRQWGFICTAELLWKLRVVGARCSEVPFVLRYDLKESSSRMRAARTIGGYGLLVLKSRLAPNWRPSQGSRSTQPDPTGM